MPSSITSIIRSLFLVFSNSNLMFPDFCNESIEFFNKFSITHENNSGLRLVVKFLSFDEKKMKN